MLWAAPPARAAQNRPGQRNRPGGSRLAASGRSAPGQQAGVGCGEAGLGSGGAAAGRSLLQAPVVRPCSHSAAAAMPRPASVSMAK